MADLNDTQKPDNTSNYSTETWQTIRGHVMRLWTGDYTGMANLATGMRRWVAAGAGNVKLLQRNSSGTEDILFDSSTKADATATASSLSTLASAVSAKADASTVSTALALKADAGANTTITSLDGANSINGGGLGGARNRIINGGMCIGNYNFAAISTTPQFAGCDRIRTWLAGYTTASGAGIQQVLQGGSSYGYAHAVVNLTTTGSGVIYFAQGIAALNCCDMSGKTVTMSVTVLGAPIAAGFQASLRLDKPGSTDNYASPTTIATSTTFNIVGGVATRISWTYTMGATDCDKGMLAYVQLFTGPLSGATLQITDWEFGIGKNAVAFSKRTPQEEELLCLAYYRPLNLSIGFANTSSQAWVLSSGPPMRRNPTLLGAAAAFGFYTPGGTVSPTGISVSNNVNGNVLLQANFSGTPLTPGATTMLTTTPSNGGLSAEIT